MNSFMLANELIQYFRNTSIATAVIARAVGYLENTYNTDTDNMLTLTVTLTLNIISHRIVTL